MNTAIIFSILILCFDLCKDSKELNRSPNSYISSWKEKVEIKDTSFLNFLSRFPTSFNPASTGIREERYRLKDFNNFLCFQGNCCGIEPNVDEIFLNYKFPSKGDSIENVILSDFTNSMDSISDDWDFTKYYFYVYSNNGLILDCKKIGIASQKYGTEYVVKLDSIFVNQITFIGELDEEKKQDIFEEKNVFYSLRGKCIQQIVYARKKGKIQYFEDKSGHLDFKHIE